MTLAMDRASSGLNWPGKHRGYALVRRTLHDIVDHFHQAHLHAVIRVVDALNTVSFQFPDFIRRDGAPAAAKYANVLRAALPELVQPCT